VTTSPPTASGDQQAAAPEADPPAREVVVGVEGTEVGLGAVRWAAREAIRRNAPLRIIHAAPYLEHGGSADEPHPALPRARRIIAQAYTVALHTDHGIRATTELVPDDPATALLRAGGGAQLVVLGISTTGAADELVLASVAVRVAARSVQPVVVVPRQRPGTAADRSAVAVLGVGDRADDEAVATFAAEAAERYGVGLTVLQTRNPDNSGPESWVDDPDEWQRRYPGLTVSRTDLPAARADQLMGASCPAPLMVISAGSGSLLHRTLDGPHRWLLRHCTSPMALLPPEHRREQQERREEVVALV
jgi:nucleotide-binding universal stress UspA family protein